MQWSAARPECHAAISRCLDPTAISRAQEAVERAWTRTNRMAEYTSDTMPERMSDRISEYICHKYFQMVCVLNMSFPSSQNNTLNLWTKSKVLIYFHIFQPPYPTLQNNTLNRRRKLAVWVNFVIYHPSTLPDNMLNLWKKLTGWVLLIGLPHQNTTCNTVEHMNQRSISSYV